MPDKDVEIVRDALCNHHTAKCLSIPGACVCHANRDIGNAALARIEARLAAQPALVAALASLRALVRGECPMLLEDDPLELKIEAALAQARAAGKPAAGEAAG